MQQKRVVITGLGVICGIGNNAQEVWQNVVHCQSGIGPIEITDMSNIRFKNGCAIKTYQPQDHFSQKELDVIDPFAQVAVIAARQAVKDAGIEWTAELQQRTGVITGTSIGGEQTQD